MKISVMVHPKSRTPRIEQDLLGNTHVYVGQPPLEGKANQAVIETLAAHFQVKKRKVVLLSGHRSQIKLFEINT